MQCAIRILHQPLISHQAHYFCFQWWWAKHKIETMDATMCSVILIHTQTKKKKGKKDRTLQVKASFATQTKPWSHPFSQLDEFHSYVRNKNVRLSNCPKRWSSERVVPSVYIKRILSPHMLYPVSNGRDGKTDLKKVHKCRTERTKIVLRKTS